jgi:hypothetical protein
MLASTIISREGRLQMPYQNAPNFEKRKDATQSLVFKAVTLTDAIWKKGSKGTITISFITDPDSPPAAWSLIGNQSNNPNPGSPSMNLGFMDPPFNSFDYKGVSYDVPLREQRNHCGAWKENDSEYKNKTCNEAKENNKQFINCNSQALNKCTSGPSPSNCNCRTGWTPGATVIHEFGHALGMMHEHQNNMNKTNKIELNISEVRKSYPDEKQAQTNVIDRYDCDGNDCEYGGTTFDPESIMLYFLPDNWVVGKNPTKANFKLSADDLGWLKNIYPMNESKKPEITVIFVDRNAPEWKKAWVEKVVTEAYADVGIKWIFPNKLLKQTSPTTTAEEPVKTSTTSLLTEAIAKLTDLTKDTENKLTELTDKIEGKEEEDNEKEDNEEENKNGETLIDEDCDDPRKCVSRPVINSNKSDKGENKEVYAMGLTKGGFAGVIIGIIIGIIILILLAIKFIHRKG